MRMQGKNQTTLCEKENWWFPELFPFCTIFLIAVYARVVKTLGRVVKDINSFTTE